MELYSTQMTTLKNSDMYPYFRNNIASFTTPTLTAAATSIAVSGEIAWFKDGVWGIAYKKSSASSWTYVPTDDKVLSEETITGLDASTSYDVCLYVKFDGTYQKSAKATISTTAA